MLALDRCAARGVEFASAFRYQYVIARHALDLPGFHHQVFAGHHIHTGRALPVTPLHDRHGLPVGLLLGLAADDAGIVAGQRRLMRLDTADPEAFARLEDWIDGLAGRWTLLVAIGRDIRLYADPAGMNGVVYNRRLRRVAASVPLCLDDAMQDHPQYDHALNETEGAKYTLFDTRDARVRRLNPSCWLDMRRLVETRFWPRPASLARPGALGPHYDAIIATARARIDALSGARPCLLPLSGGRDSRLLAGFAGPALHRMAGVFTHVTNYATRRDASIGAALAAELGVPHQVLDYCRLRRSAADLAALRDGFQAALGWDATPPDEYRLGLVLDLPEDAVILRGHQTDILRAVLRDRPGAAGRADLRWQVKRLMPVPYRRFSGAVYRRFRRRYAAWVAALPDHARDHQIDLMFAEVYYPSSLGATFPALFRNFYLSPFNCRRLIGMAMAIDEDYRHQSLAVDDLLYRMAPSLHHVPLDYETLASLDSFDDPAHRRALVRARAMRTAARAGSLMGGM